MCYQGFLRLPPICPQNLDSFQVCEFLDLHALMCLEAELFCVKCEKSEGLSGDASLNFVGEVWKKKVSKGLLRCLEIFP